MNVFSKCQQGHCEKRSSIYGLFFFTAVLLRGKRRMVVVVRLGFTQLVAAAVVRVAARRQGRAGQDRAGQGTTISLTTPHVVGKNSREQVSQPQPCTASRHCAGYWGPDAGATAAAPPRPAPRLDTCYARVFTYCPRQAASARPACGQRAASGR